MRSTRVLAYVFGIVAFAFLPMSPLAPAQAATSTAAVSGTVHDHNGAPVGGASVLLQGAAQLRTTTNNSGAFHFDSVPAGLYTLQVIKAGFSTYENTDITAFAGETATVAVVLAPSTFTSLRTIASVTTNAPGRAQINTSTAAINSISNQTFTDQAQTQVTKLLNETPGIIAYGNPENNNGASKGSPQIIQIRGALPYESESLIDGHPTALGLSGAFNPTFLNPALLQNVELVKGPGAMPTEINYAIGGTVNFRTLEPTRTPQGAVSVGSDNWGGISTAFRATGSVASHHLDYAMGYATDGTPGALRNYPVAGSQLYLVAGAPPWTLNGQQIAAFPEVVGPAPPNVSNFIGVVGAAQFQEPLYVCCSNINTGYHATSELAKLRYNFSQASAFTISYLGGQSASDLGGIDMASLGPVGQTSNNFSIFMPPPGYTGSIQPGTPVPFDLQAFLPQFQTLQASLYQAEFRTSFGPWAALARYFIGNSHEYVYLATPNNAPFTFGGQTWGGIPLCPAGANFNFNFSTPGCVLSNGSTVAPTMTFFNGQQATFATQNAVNDDLEVDHLRGGSVELDRQSDNGNEFSISFDRSHHDSSSFSFNPPNGIEGFTLPPGSSQHFTTEMLRYRFSAAPKLSTSLADYFIQYTSHFTGDGGVTWQDATHGYNAPRLALSWRPNPDVAWRLSLGASIAPPFLSLISSQGGTPTPNINGVPSAGYTENANNGAIRPETSWGYDLGIDKRIAQSTAVSVDLYLSTLRDMFLPSTFLDGTFTPPPGQFGAGQPWPLYISETANLGHARYEGLEFAIDRTPAIGWGFRLQGNLQRAYAYGLPPDFYCAALPPGVTSCTPQFYSTNLGIIPNVNFQASGLGWNTINGVSVPYTSGYFEINDHTAHGAYFNLGWTYFGSNNTYSQPAFVIMSGSWRTPLAPGTTAQISVDNLLGTYGKAWTNYFGGIPAPLVNGLVGPTIGGNYGPTTWHLIFTHEFGQK